MMGPARISLLSQKGSELMMDFGFDHRQSLMEPQMNLHCDIPPWLALFFLILEKGMSWPGLLRKRMPIP